MSEHDRQPGCQTSGDTDSDAASSGGPGLFVAGTGTGVGKTVVTAAIVTRCRERGIGARGIKPVQTGPDDDAGVVRETCGEDESAVATCLRQIDPALAPRVAADRTDTTLSYDRIRADCRTAIAGCEAGIVEGIGGLRVPLAGEREVIDLAGDLGLPAVVVSRPDLGTLNHTALTVTALRNRGVPVRGVLVSGQTDGSIAQRTNPDELRRMLDVPIAVLPRIEESDPAAIARCLVPQIPAWALPISDPDRDDDGGAGETTFSVRMRASDGDRHVSGAETLVDRPGSAAVRAATFTDRAFDHPRGNPDTVTLTIDAVEREAETGPALPVTTVETTDPAESRSIARERCRAAGATADAIEAGFDVLRSETGHGATVLDETTGESLAEGVRVSRFGTTPAGDAALEAAIAEAGLAETRIKDALLLATTVVRSGATAELCWSDDPDYTTGYVATAAGYYRFPRMQDPGDSRGGRAILVDPTAVGGIDGFLDRLTRMPFRVDAADSFHHVTAEQSDSATAAMDSE